MGYTLTGFPSLDDRKSTNVSTHITNSINQLDENRVGYIGSMLWPRPKEEETEGESYSTSEVSDQERISTKESKERGIKTIREG